MKLYNTLSRQVEEFKPLNDNKVLLYTCGLTVYSQPHIGNWVAYIYWDVLVRTLRASGYDVNHVQNITDVGHLTSDEDAGEDKMLKGALAEGLSAWKVAEKYISIANHEAFDLLGLTKPTHLPRATDYIDQQKDFVEQLNAKGFTYTIDDGIYFDTSKLANYGQLAKLDVDGLRFGARVADSGKKNPTDFAVWKFSDPNEKRDMEWDSPLGISKKGFPGWHLECSVMARELLGDQIDIHTGGIDHIPVHHTNEIAQTESVTGKQFANFWLHTNHLKVNGTKISKSLGNTFTLKDLSERGYDINAFKLMVLSKHYQTEGNFTWEILDAAQNRLINWQASADLRWQVKPESEENNSDQAEKQKIAIINVQSQVLQNLQNNLGTPAALASIDNLFAELDKLGLLASNISSLNSLIDKIKSYLGIDLNKSDINQTQKDLLEKREAARSNQEWSESDRLRDELKQTGLKVRDTDYGQIWSRTK